MRHKPSFRVLSCSAQNCGALSLLIQGRNAYHCASELTSGLSLRDSTSAAFPPLRSPFSPNAPASANGKFQIRGFAGQCADRPCEPQPPPRHWGGPPFEWSPCPNSRVAHLRQIGPAPQVKAPKSRRSPRSFTPRYEIWGGGLKPAQRSRLADGRVVMGVGTEGIQTREYGD